MKKLLLACMVSFMLAGSLSAQTPTEKKKDTKTAAEVVKSQAAHTKKDGTADLRYKENKAAKDAKEAKPAGPVKKDGTPDKRYKANKAKS